MDNYIITISREFGSGGRPIGEGLAKDLGIPFYDKEILHMAAEKSGLSPDFIQKGDETLSSSFLHNLKYVAYSGFDSMSYYSGLDTMSYYDTPITDKVFHTQATVIKEIASQGNCVIVGRCADYILRDHPGLIRVFVRGKLEDRVKFAIDNYDLSSQKATEEIKKIDKQRANYYKYYTTRQWASIQNFDIVINSSMSGVDGAISIIKTMIGVAE